jgi:hypothetical protein
MPSLDPVIYFFVLGLAAGLLKADLRLPPAIYEFVSTLLLLAIGMKGGVELAKFSLGALFIEMAVVVTLGVVLTLAAFGILRWPGRFGRIDAAAIAAHYGSVSVATFAVGVAYLATLGMTYEPQMPLLLVLLEVPALIVAIVLARGGLGQTRWGALLREVLLGRSVLLLVGGLVIGAAAGAEDLQPVGQLFFGLFKGLLAIFLLEMGLIAAHHVGGLRARWAFLMPFALAVPVLFGFAGVLTARMLGYSEGGACLLATLAASASYIAAPAAMRSALPEANPALSLSSSLAVTFPFNIVVGIPIYRQMVAWLYG